MRTLLPFGLFFVCVSVGCGDKDAYIEDSGSTSTDGTGGDGADGTGADGADGTDGTEAGTANLVGRVKYADGSPAANLQMRLCNVTCRVANTDADGAFRYDAVEGTTHTLQAVTLGDLDMAIPNALVTLEDDATRELDAPITTVPYDNRQDLSETPADYDLAGGLTILGAASGDLDILSYSPAPTESFVASVRISPEESGLPWDNLPNAEGARAVWYLGNFDADVLGTGWAFSLADDLGLPEGSKVRIYSANNHTKVWTDGGTATVGSDGTLTSDPGAGIQDLTTLVLVAE